MYDRVPLLVFVIFSLDELNVVTDVPQGSFLDPLLFVTYISQILTGVHQSFVLIPVLFEIYFNQIFQLVITGFYYSSLELHCLQRLYILNGVSQGSVLVPFSLLSTK